MRTERIRMKAVGEQVKVDMREETTNTEQGSWDT